LVQRDDATALIGPRGIRKCKNAKFAPRPCASQCPARLGGALRDGRASLRLPAAQAAVARFRWREGSATADAQWWQHEVRLLRGPPGPAHAPGPAAPRQRSRCGAGPAGALIKAKARARRRFSIFIRDKLICPKSGLSAKPDPPPHVTWRVRFRAPKRLSVFFFRTSMEKGADQDILKRDPLCGKPHKKKSK
jgi:hypothetical protein